MRGREKGREGGVRVAEKGGRARGRNRVRVRGCERAREGR